MGGNLKKTLLFLCASTVLGAAAFAAYDSSWYQTQFWSGEWPNGFSVRRVGVVVVGRNTMDLDEVPSVNCELPIKAVFHPWNTARNELSNAEYHTASKIVPLRVKEEFDIPADGEKPALHMTPGMVIEYLIYHSEGSFAIRVNGVEYEGDLDMLEHLEEGLEGRTQQDQWLKLTCVNGVTTWLNFADLSDPDWQDGLNDVGNGLKEYGLAEDLTDEDLK